MTGITISKFGEYTFADPERIKRAAEIIKSDPSRRFVTAVAPGRRNPDDVKITDLLCMAHANSINGENYMDILMQVQERFAQIIHALKIDFDLAGEFDYIKKSLLTSRNLDYVASRGEYLMAKIFAKFLGWEFIDSTRMIFFDGNGEFNADKSLHNAASLLKNVPHAVIPGFYGAINGTTVKTFAREDCDTSAVIIAAAVNADVLERWTEPKTIYVTDPAIVNSPQIIRNMTYGELVEFSYMGFEIVNELALFQLYKYNVIMSIRNIDDVNDPGTLITQELPADISRNPVASIAGRRNYKVLHVEKFGINKEAGFMEKLFSVFTKRNISCEHCITGIHRLSVLIKHPMFHLRRDKILTEIKDAVNPHNLYVDDNISIIAVIGQGLEQKHWLFAKIFDSLSEADIEVCMIAQGSDKIHIAVGVHDKDYERAVQILYNQIFSGE